MVQIKDPVLMERKIPIDGKKVLIEHVFVFLYVYVINFDVFISKVIMNCPTVIVVIRHG